MASFEETLHKYARLTIQGGVNLQSGQELIIIADVTEAPFVRMLTEEAYKAGAKNALVLYMDEPSALVRYAHGSEQAISYAPVWLFDAVADQICGGAAFLRVFGSNPALLKDVDPAKVATSSKAMAVANQRSQEAFGAMVSNFCIVAHASAPWARQVFPNESEDKAVARLWDAIFSCTYADAPDPVKAWNEHCADLEARRDWLNASGLTALHFKATGTDLIIGLAEGNKFAGGRVKTKPGIVNAPNVPTEEVFGMPHKDRVNGVVRSSKPLSVRGQIIDGIEMEFKNGKAFKAKAAKGDETLQGLLNTDDGARHLGEVALVPNSSRVSQANILFLNTLYDENAACHIAIGQALGENMTGFETLAPEERARRGANESLIHVDWMIGSGEMDIDGIRADGSTIPVMRAGEWAG